MDKRLLKCAANGAGLLGAAIVAGSVMIGSALADDPIKIGFGFSQTGPLAPNGKQALLGAKIWEEEVNAKGGLLGRKVELISYDDQSNPANVPGIYAKLLDVDKVDLIVGPYGTNLVAPAFPVVMPKGKVMIGLFALEVNSHFHYRELFLDGALRTGSEGFFGRRVFRSSGGAKPEAADGGDHFGRQ